MRLHDNTKHQQNQLIVKDQTRNYGSKLTDSGNLYKQIKLKRLYIVWTQKINPTIQTLSVAKKT